MVSCSAYGCTNRPEKKAPGVTFHRFPKDENQRQEWILAVGRKNWIPSKVSVLCSLHFSEDVIDRTSVTTIRLRENAIPTIFKGYPTYLKKTCKVRKTQFSENLSNPSSSTNLPDVEMENTHLMDASLQNGDQDIIVLDSDEELPLENNNLGVAVSNLNEESSSENGDHDVIVSDLDEELTSENDDLEVADSNLNEESSSENDDLEVTDSNLNEESSSENGDQGVTVSNLNEDFRVTNGDQGITVSNPDAETFLKNGAQGITVSNPNAETFLKNGAQGITVSNPNAELFLKYGAQGITVSNLNGDESIRLSNLDGGSYVINKNQRIVIFNLKEESSVKNRNEGVTVSRNLYEESNIVNENQSQETLDLPHPFRKTQVDKLKETLKTKNKQIKLLQQQVRRYRKRIDKFYTLLKNKKEEKITNEDVLRALNAHLQ